MLALIAGQGRLPGVLVERLRRDDRPFAVFEMDGFAAELPGDLPVTRFRLEHLGSLLNDLQSGGFDSVCFAGSIRRPVIDPALIDAATQPLVGAIKQAISGGDDGALRVIMSLFEDRGLEVCAAHDIVPDLLVGPGVPTRQKPGASHEQDVKRANAVLGAMGAVDLGQSCVVTKGQVMGVEAQSGTDFMLHSLSRVGPNAPALAQFPMGGILYKAPKPGQDRRADLPTIGVNTIKGAVDARLEGVVITAGGVMVLDLQQVVAQCDAAGLFLWVRDAP